MVCPGRPASVCTHGTSRIRRHGTLRARPWCERNGAHTASMVAMTVTPRDATAAAACGKGRHGLEGCLPAGAAAGERGRGCRRQQPRR